MGWQINRLDDWCVENWRKWTQFWSVRMTAAGAVLYPLLIMVPSMPQEVQNLLPPAVRVIAAAVWCILTIIVRLKAQKKLNA